MIGRERRRRHHYWEGFRDALQFGARDPMKYESGGNVADQPGYMEGFRDGEQAVERIRSGA